METHWYALMLHQQRRPQAHGLLSGSLGATSVRATMSDPSPPPPSHLPAASGLPALRGPRRAGAGARSRASGQALLRGVLLALAIAVAALAHWGGADAPAVRDAEAFLRDRLMRWQADERQDPRVGIVDIDEASLGQVGRWPWPRATLAELAERLLAEEGASLVVFDLVLSEPLPDEGFGDQRLAALARDGRLVAAQAFDFVRREGVLASGVVGGGLERSVPAVTAAAATGHVGNFEALAAARCVGNIGFVPDHDGKIRRLAPLTAWQGREYPMLALAALGCARGQSQQSPPPALVAGLPIDGRGQWRVPFSHRPDSYLSVPAHAVLDGSLAASPQQGPDPGRPLAGRIVLVGSSALGLADRVATPLSPNTSGVGVHAAALTGLLDRASGRAPSVPPPWVMPAWALLSIGALWWSIAGAAGRLRRALAVLIPVLAGWLALAAWMTATGRVEPVSSALFGYALVLLVHLPVEWSWAQRRARDRTRLLSRYVSQPVLEELLAAPESDPLRPRRAEITVLIADLQDYTRLTSGSSLEEAATLTRGLLEALTRAVLAHRGTLDRYTGDGLVAFWGAPIPDPAHADAAVDAARAILANVRALNAARVAQGLEPLSVRIGLASGPALVGDLGTPFRASYTAVGDCINLASRLQQLAKEIGVTVLASESVAGHCRAHRFRAAGKVDVRGLPQQRVFIPEEPPAAAHPDPRPAA